MTNLFRYGYISQYRNEVLQGNIKVSSWVYKLLELINKGLDNRLFYFNPKLERKAITFIENFCHHSKGRSDLLKLELWQKAVISSIFAIVDENGYRQFREVIIVVARKNGKSLLASAIIAYCAYLDKEYGAEIYCLAPKLEQASIVFDSFYQTISKEQELMDMSKKRRTDIYIEKSNTIIKPLAFSDKKSDGLNPHLTICDEIASWSGLGGLRMYEVISSALGARLQPLIISISTAGYQNDSIYDELINRATSMLNGNSQESRLLPWLFMIDDVERWDDIEELEKSNPNLGVSVSREHLLEEIRIAKGSISKKVEFITKYCNIKQSSSVSWLDYETIQKCSLKQYDLNDFKECYAVGGIDLSQTTDLTCASVVIEKNGQEYTFSQFFMPRNKLEILTDIDKVPYDVFVRLGVLTLSGENYVDYKDVKAWFDMLRSEYSIYCVRIGYDRYSAQYLVDDMSAKGYRMDDVTQGWNLAPIIRELEGKMKDGTIHLGNNNLLKSHFMNVALKYENDNTRFKPAKIKQTTHIDGFVSVVDALTVKAKYYSEIKYLISNSEE